METKQNTQISNCEDLLGFLNEINDICKVKVYENYTKLSDLPQNIAFTIKEIKKGETKYGEKLFIKLMFKGLGVEAEYKTMLPDRFNRMSEPQMLVLTSNPGIKFIYNGKDKNGHHLLNFINEFQVNKCLKK